MQTLIEEKLEFIAVLTREFPNKSIMEIREFVIKICRMGSKSKRFAEQECNVGLTDRQIKQEEKLYAKIIEYAVGFGCDHVVTSGDPRGYTIKLVLPSHKSNNWGNEGWGVPTS